MFRSWKRWLGSEKKHSLNNHTSVNKELLQAITERNQMESPRTLKAFYEAFQVSTLWVALPATERELATSFVDCLRRGDEFPLIGRSSPESIVIWYIFTDEAALRRWRATALLSAPVPALDILWTAAKNNLTLAINPGDCYPTQAYLTHEEIQTLAEGRYPPAAQSKGVLAGTVIQILPLDCSPSEALQKALSSTLRHKPAVANAYVFNAEFGYQGYCCCLGLEFEGQVDDQGQQEIYRQLRQANLLPPTDRVQLVLLTLWDEIMEEVRQHGVNVYCREQLDR